MSSGSNFISSRPVTNSRAKRIPSYDTDIGALGAQILWLVADRKRLTLIANKAQEWADRSVLGGKVTQVEAARQPIYLPDAFAGAGGLQFGYSAATGYIALKTVPTAGDFTIALVIKPDDQSNNAQRLIWIGGATGSYAAFQITGDGRLQWRVGDNTTSASVTTAAGYVSNTAPNAEISVLLSYNYAAKRVRMSINGGTPLEATTPGTPDLASGAIRIGFDANTDFPYNGLVGDIDILSADIFSTANAGLLALMKQYHRGRYGLNVGVPSSENPDNVTYIFDGGRI